MNRRQYLATAAAVLVPSLAGCADPEAVLDMEAVSAEDIATRASRDVSGHPEAGDLVAAAVANGSTTASGRSPPLDTNRPIAFEGSYYNFSVSETGQREMTEYPIRIDYDPETESQGGETIDYDSLPTVDKSALDPLLPPPDETPSSEGYDFGIGQEYTDEEAEQSVLVPQQEYDAIGYEGTAYPIQVGDSRTVTVSDYRYEADELAADAGELAAQLRSESLFELSGLSADERDVVAEAIDDGYYEGDTTDAFESLVERFRSHPAIESDEWGGDWLVRYEGTVYWADLRHPPSIVEE